MSKAVAGAAMLGVDAAMLAGLVLMPVASPLLATLFNTLAMPLLAGGISMEAGAIAQALGSNTGMGVTTRQAAGYRQIIRGVQRVGGTTVFCSTGFADRKYYNMVIALASHPCEAIEAVYLDGRKVYFNTSSTYNQTVNGINFGGDSDANSHIGPMGQRYNFGGEVFCAAFQGLQTSDPTVVSGAWVGPSVIDHTVTSYPGFCSALYANDNHWDQSNQNSVGSAVVGVSLMNSMSLGELDTLIVDNGGFGYADTTSGYVDITDPNGSGSGASAHYIASGGSVTSVVVDTGGTLYLNPLVVCAAPSSTTVIPYLAGCTYVYLKIVADSANFPAFPEVRFTVHGKHDIWDPRTSTYGFTENWALNVADAITDPVWGLGDNTVNQAQLIAAANICDESVSCAAGVEKRYCLNWHYDTSTAPGDVIAQMMDAAAGRLSRIGGEWFIFPAGAVTPSASFDESALITGLQWTPKRPMADLCNRITGTYIAANYPYNVAGDMYDSNGYYNGAMQNNFPFGFQPSNYPMYACDQLHGYGTGVDVYLTQDGGIYLPKEVNQPCVLSISQAQRVAKIMLLRNRQQGSGTLTMGLNAWLMQPNDVFTFSMPSLGWTSKTLEVTKMTLKQQPGTVGFYVELQVQEYDASVYEWEPQEELNPYDRPISTPTSTQFTVQPPTGLTAISNMSTALVAPDGSVTPRIEATWIAPADSAVLNGGTIELQIRDHAAVAAPALVQSASNIETTTYTGVVSTTSPVTVGNLLVGAVGWNPWPDEQPMANYNDSLSNPWITQTIDGGGNSPYAYGLGYTMVTTGGSDTVTNEITIGSSISNYVAEFSGVDTFEGINYASGGATGGWLVAPATTLSAVGTGCGASWAYSDSHVTLDINAAIAYPSTADNGTAEASWAGFTLPTLPVGAVVSSMQVILEATTSGYIGSLVTYSGSVPGLSSLPTGTGTAVGSNVYTSGDPYAFATALSGSISMVTASSGVGAPFHYSLSTTVGLLVNYTITGGAPSQVAVSYTSLDGQTYSLGAMTGGADWYASISSFKHSSSLYPEYRLLIATVSNWSGAYDEVIAGWTKLSTSPGFAVYYQIVSTISTAWRPSDIVGGSVTQAFLGNVVSGLHYDLRAHSVRASGAYSVWVELDDVTVGFALGASGLNPVAPPSTLTAYTVGTVSTIIATPFVATYFGNTASCSGATVTGLTPNTLYYCWYRDPSFVGGTIVMYATQNTSDFVSIPGDFLIGSIRTPASGGTVYTPTTYSDIGASASSAPGVVVGNFSNPFGGPDYPISTLATVRGMGNPSLPSYTLGQLIYNGFTSFTSTAGQTLYVIMSEVATPGTGDPAPTSEWAITACVGGGTQPTGTLGTLNSRGAWAATTAYALWDTFTSSGITYLVVTGYTSGGSFGSTDAADTCVLLVSGTGGSMSYTTQSVAIPVGTNLSTISVTITANPPLTGGLQWVELGDGSEPSIYIQ